MKKYTKYFILFIIFGFIYIIVELLYRRCTHWTMFIVGGISGIFCGIINEFIPWDMPIWLQATIGASGITAIEFLSGIIINRILQWNVWDYGGLPYNILGQICLPYSLAWFILAHIAIIFDDYLRYWFFGEEKPHYTIKWKVK